MLCDISPDRPRPNVQRNVQAFIRRASSMADKTSWTTPLACMAYGDSIARRAARAVGTVGEGRHGVSIRSAWLQTAARPRDVHGSRPGPGGRGRSHGVPADLLAVPAHLVPHGFDALKSGALVACVHEVARPQAEILQRLPLGRLHGRDRAPKGEVSKIDVPALVHDLGGGVELGVQLGNGVDPRSLPGGSSRWPSNRSTGFSWPSRKHLEVLMGGFVVVVPQRLELVGHPPCRRLLSSRHSRVSPRLNQDGRQTIRIDPVRAGRRCARRLARAAGVRYHSSSWTSRPCT
jgi:hypothetical protein